MNTDNHQIITDFFKAYMSDLCPLLNPLDNEHSQSFIKFRSEVEIAEVSKVFENSNQEMTVFSFHLLPDEITKFKFKIIEDFFYQLLTGSGSVVSTLSDKPFVIDICYKRLTEYTFPAIHVKIYFIGDYIDLNFVSLLNYQLFAANSIIKTDPGKWEPKKVCQLSIFLSNRNTDPFDFFPFSNYLMIAQFSFNHLVNLNLINFYVPKIFTINDFYEMQSPILGDIGVKEYDNLPGVDEYNEGDYEGD